MAQPQTKNSTFTVYIYGLVDPRTGYVRYVGKSHNPKNRLNGHLIERRLKDNTHKSHWLNSLVSCGLKPELIILEETNRNDWPSAETKWIAYYRSIPGYPKLTNKTNGGEGTYGYRFSDEQKDKLRKKRTPTQREHCSEGQRKRWVNSSEEEKQKMLQHLRYEPSIQERMRRSKSARNAKRTDDACSKYRNVVRETKNGRSSWRAGCIINGKQVCIGHFQSEEAAARARDQYVLKHIGEDVVLNFPRSNYHENPSNIIVEKNKRIYTQTPNRRNSSGYMGVTRNGPRLWTAAVSHLGVRYRLGTHKTKELAAQAYDRKVIELLGDKARTNFPRSSYD